MKETRHYPDQTIPHTVIVWLILIFLLSTIALACNLVLSEEAYPVIENIKNK